jgi:hypothetical protein
MTTIILSERQAEILQPEKQQKPLKKQAMNLSGVKEV